MSSLIADLKREKVFIIIVAVIFLLGSILGIMMQDRVYQGLKKSDVLDTLQKSAKQLKKNPTFLNAFYQIFTNNLKVSFFAVLVGILIFPLSLLIVFTNGMVVGVVVMQAAEQSGVNPFLLFVTTVLPHGVFEIPAIIIACAIGLHAALSSIQLIYLWFKKKHHEYLSHWKSLWKRIVMLFLFVVMLLFTAGVIESLLIVSMM